MHRFYCLSQNIKGDQVSIEDKKQLHHARDVLRLKRNAEVIIFDAQGNEYTSLIKEITDKRMLLAIKNKRLPRVSKVKISVACAIPKKSKFDDIVDKLTQLGVERIIPLLTERVIVKWTKEKRMLEQKRWEKIALCASEQSQRSTLPIIEPIKEIREVLSESTGFDLKLIPALIGKRKSLKEIFAQFNPSQKSPGFSPRDECYCAFSARDESLGFSPGRFNPQNILFFIGPEGDFTEQELAWAVEAGCIPVSLGDLVLRVETAAVAVVSFMRLYESR